MVLLLLCVQLPLDSVCFESGCVAYVTFCGVVLLNKYEEI